MPPEKSKFLSVSVILLVAVLGYCFNVSCDYFDENRKLKQSLHQFTLENPGILFNFPDDDNQFDLIRSNMDASFYLITNQRFKQAKAILLTVIEKEPNNPIALNNLAGIQMNEGIFGDALKTSEKAIEYAGDTKIKNLSYFLVINGGAFHFYLASDGDTTRLKLYQYPKGNVAVFFADGEGAIDRIAKSSSYLMTENHILVDVKNGYYLLRPEIDKNIKFIKSQLHM